MFIYINGEFVLESEAKISPFDHGFLYGLGVFETFRIYDGHPFLLDDHFQRLVDSLELLNIECKVTKRDILNIINELLLKNNLKNAYVRLNVSAGVSPIGLNTEPYTEPTIIMFIKPLNTPLSKTKKAQILKIKRNTPEGNFRLKSHHYLNNIFGKREVPNADIEGIFLTNEGFIAEGVVSNIFWVKDDQVYTPSLDTGILNGITRQFIIRLLEKEGIMVCEGLFTSDQLIQADEIFITNSIQEVVAVSGINDTSLQSKNHVTLYLQSLYKKYTDELRLWTRKDI